MTKSILSKSLILGVAGILAFGVASNARAAEPIIIGVQAPITGQYANEGQGIANGTKLIVEQVNKQGGLLGRKLEVKVCDDQGDAAHAAICARQLVNAGALAVIGSYTSGAALAAQPIYARANVIQTSDGTSDELTQKGYKTFFRNAPNASAEAEFTVEYLKSVGLKKVAIITDHSSFATGLAESVEKEAKAASLNIVSKESITANSQDYTAVLTKIKSLNPEAIYFSGYYTDGGLIKAQMKQLGIKAAFVGGDACQNTEFAKIAGAAADGSIIIALPEPKDLPLPAAKEFFKNYTDTYKTMPASVFTFTNPDGLRAIIHVAEQIKSIDPAKLIPALHKMKDFEGITGTFSWDEVGERIGNPFVAYEITSSGNRVVWPKSTK